MILIEIKNDNGLVLKVSTKKRLFSEPIRITGGDCTNPCWDDYLHDWNVNSRKYPIMIRQAIEELGWIGDGAEKRAGNTFYFSDGMSFIFTHRAWGDLMQAIIDKNEGFRKYK